MKAPLGCASAVLLAAIWAAPAGALTPAPLSASAPFSATPVQFRFPWEARPQRKRPRAKRTTRAPKARAARPPAKRTPREKLAAPARADPKAALLPALAVPLGLLPRGATAAELEGWTALAAQAPEPPSPPLLSPEGPAPAPANVVALMAALPQGSPEAGEDEDDETDAHVPLPPVRPSVGRAARPPVAGLAPEGRGLAPEGQGLAPESGLAPETVPLPPAREERRAALEPEVPPPPVGPTAPAIPLPVTSREDDPACAALADESFAVAKPIPAIEGPGVCGSGPLVSLSGVRRRDGGLVEVKPAATLRCAMAKTLADYLRDDVAPAAEKDGARLERLDVAGSYVCRGRNGASGGRMSEHGRANAVDLAGFGFADGRAFGIFAADLPVALRAAAKTGACEKFDTALGPGSDGFHESHLHLDLQPRRSKAKLCQWSDAPLAGTKDGGAAGKADEPKAAARRKADRTEDPLPKGGQTP